MYYSSPHLKMSLLTFYWFFFHFKKAGQHLSKRRDKFKKQNQSLSREQITQMRSLPDLIRNIAFYIMIIHLLHIMSMIKSFFVRSCYF